MNQNSARKLTRVHGGRLTYDTAAHTFTVARSDGYKSQVSKGDLACIEAAEFKKRFLEIPK